MTTKIFFDTEFTGLHKNTTLISIGLISDCGKTFYAELNDYDTNQIDDWLQENVMDKLLMHAPSNGEHEYYLASRHHDNPVEQGLYQSYSLQLRCNKSDLEKALRRWFKQFHLVEIWSDCLSYDWVLFCDIFGHAFNIPSNIYYIPFDICTLFRIKDIDSDIVREYYAGMEPNAETKKHNALFDAKIIKMCYEKLTGNAKQ